jgi:D-alanine-D-alanine ligase
MKTTIALVTGGFTGEAVISLKSANVIEKNLDTEKFDVYKIIITRTSWYYEDANGFKNEIDRNHFTLTLKEEIIRFDVVFIALHGSPGEDGKLQGYFDMLQIPYTTCDALTSAITMNKGYTKAIVSDIPNLHIARSKQLFDNTKANIDFINTTLKLPYFVKPNNGGSSIGMSKVKTVEELPTALEKALQKDTQVLVEEFIQGREFTIGVYKSKNGIKVLPTTEVIPSKEFFDFEAKYTPGVTEEITPGRMSVKELRQVEQVAAAVYQKLNCNGMTRIDFILEEKSDNFYFIEINTVPGQTETSFIPQQVRATGMTLKEFYTELIEVTLA